MIAFVQTDRQTDRQTGGGLWRHARTRASRRARGGGVTVVCLCLSQSGRRKKDTNGKRFEVSPPIFAYPLSQANPREKREREMRKKVGINKMEASLSALLMERG